MIHLTPIFANSCPISPCVLKISGGRISTLLEPRTTAYTTASLAFSVGPALGTPMDIYVDFKSIFCAHCWHSGCSASSRSSSTFRLFVNKILITTKRNEHLHVRMSRYDYIHHIQTIMGSLLHALAPSVHVCLNLSSPGSPQFGNQEPPGAQQLFLPDLALTPHWGHTIVSTWVGTLPCPEFSPKY